ncbi:MAG TPA: carbohydrate-binding family 9-like protein [Polyangia bacterium]|jgi:hypothetical protein|nr:carbohydrate-binding family 9-like protein [Polyangia bacterium]
MRSLAFVAPLALGVFATIAGCHKPDPAWSRPSARHLGDDTITGVPLDIPRAAAAPVLDGKLDDAAWTTAAELGPFVDVGSGRVIDRHPIATFARMTYDDRALYVGVIVRDADPTSPFTRDDRDPHVWGKSSGIEVMLQPGDPNDNRDYYELQVDVAGAVFDSHFDDYNAPITGSGAAKVFGHQDWASGVERATFVDPGRFYAVELALPWASLAPARVAVPPHPGDVWRVELYSFRDGQRLSLGWSSIRGQGNFHRASRFGRIRFQ